MSSVFASNLKMSGITRRKEDNTSINLMSKLGSNKFNRPIKMLTFPSSSKNHACTLAYLGGLVWAYDEIKLNPILVTDNKNLPCPNDAADKHKNPDAQASPLYIDDVNKFSSKSQQLQACRVLLVDNRNKFMQSKLSYGIFFVVVTCSRWKSQTALHNQDQLLEI